MSQPPPQDPGQPSNQGQQPDQGQLPSWPSGDQPPSWPSGNQPPSWPSENQSPSWPSGDHSPAWPSQSPPPSWPSGAPDQGQPPSWPPGNQPPSWPPPGGQPPYPGSGYAYGYGPRPPRPKRRHPFRGALIVLGLFVVFGIVVRTATGSHTSDSTTPSGTLASGGPASAPPVPPGKLGSSFDVKDGSGNTYQITLARVIDPAKGANQVSSPDSGKRFVGLVFRIKALSGSPQNEDANNDAALIGGNGQTYSADFDGIAGYTNFDTGVIHVAQGDTVTGAVTFRVPDGVTVSKVQWNTLSGFGSTVEWKLGG